MKQQKNCLINSHNKDDASGVAICIQKICQQKSRILCLECLTEGVHNNHILLNSNHILNNLQNNTKNWPPHCYQIQDIKNYKDEECLIEDLTNLQEQISQNLDKVCESVIEKIQKIKKEMKLLILKNQENFKINLESFKNAMDVQFNLKPLQEKVKEFENNIINTQDLSYFADKFVNKIYQNEKLQKIQEQQELLKSCTQKIRIDNQEMLLNIKKYEEQIQDYLNKIPLPQIVKIEKDRRKDENYIVVKIINQYNFNFQPEYSSQQNCKITGNSVYEGLKQGMNNFRSKQIFKRSERIQFKFRIVEHFNLDNFFIGICSKNDFSGIFWYKTGIQIDLKYLINEQKFKGSNNKNLNLETTIFVLEVLVDKNLMIIKNQEESIEYRNLSYFEKNIENWQIVFGNNGNGGRYKLLVL